MRLTSGVLLAALCLAAAVSASDYYISTTGSDSNSGTSPDSPFLHLSTALAAASSGDTIYAADGHYAGIGLNVGLDITDVNLVGNGTNTIFGDNVVPFFSLYGTMTIANLQLNGFGSQKGVTVHSDDITVDSVTFTSLLIGVELASDAVDVSVVNSDFTWSVARGIDFYSTKVYSFETIVVQNCTFSSHENSFKLYTSSTEANNWRLLSFTDCTFSVAYGLVDLWHDGIGVEEAVFDSCVFSNVTSDEGGGALSIASLGSVTVTDCYFVNCTTSTGDGGAILVSYGSSTTSKSVLTVTDSVFSDCSAPGSGGAISAQSFAVSITDSLFVRNQAGGSYGGAIACANSYSTGASYSLSNLAFANNTAKMTGGAVYLAGATASSAITDCDFGFNKAQYGGGAFYSSAAEPVTVSGCRFTRNSAGNSGGAFSLDSATTMHVSDTSFQNNAAAAGGACYIDTQAVVVAEGVVASSNAATSEAGAFFFSYANGTFTTCLFNDNAAATGGAVYVQGNDAVQGASFVSLTSALFIGNEGTEVGGGIACDGGMVNVSKASFVDNSSPVGPSYACSDSCTIDASAVHVQANSTVGCSPASVVADGRDVGVTFEMFRALLDDSEE